MLYVATVQTVLLQFKQRCLSMQMGLWQPLQCCGGLHTALGEVHLAVCLSLMQRLSGYSALSGLKQASSEKVEVSVCAHVQWLMWMKER